MHVKPGITAIWGENDDTKMRPPRMTLPRKKCVVFCVGKMQ